MLKLLRLYSRLRYWRLRSQRFERDLVAVRAEYEKRFAELYSQADAERWRNVSREDTFVSAAVLGGRGMIGISPRNGPAELPAPPRMAVASDPWNAITGAEQMEFYAQWLPLGLNRGLTEQQIKQDYLKALADRKAFNDEPLN